MLLLDGRKARAHYTTLLIEKVKKLSFSPCLAIIQVGNRTDSDAFIKAKKSFAKKIGVKEIHIKLDEKVSQKEILQTIKKYNEDKDVNGIIVQLPLPSHLDSDTIINSIDPRKDTDGLTPGTIVMPATARGVSQLMDFYNINVKNKKVVVVGRSKLVGMPIAEMCRKRGGIVEVCHSKTLELAKETVKADILIVATGRAHLIKKEYVKKGAVVIDVGITRLDNGELTGDVDFQGVKDLVSMISPVPGGVGQMTVLALFENLLDACYNTKYE